MIKEMMCDFSNFNEIDAFAVSIGPGSFTSVRIALSIIKGLAFALKSNIIPVPTLEGINDGLNDKNIHYVIINSFKNKCFIQKFKGNRIIGKPFIDDMENIIKLKDKIYIYSENIVNKEYESIFPSSISLGEYAIKNSAKLSIPYNAEIKPIYLSENKFLKINDSRSK